MMHRGFLAGLPLALLFIVGACGDSSDDNGQEPGHAAVRTLAYVVSQCHEDGAPTSGQAAAFSFGQSLQIQRADGPPMTVAALPTLGGLPASGLCPLFASLRDGANSVYVGGFQRLGTSPDGSGVVFEVTFEFSLLTQMGVPNPLTPEEEGIFYVRADGTGLRRLGPASQEPAQRLIDLSGGYDIPFFGFSPDGSAITFSDRGPGPAGEDATQIALLDIATGTRMLLTHLPDAPADTTNPAVPATTAPVFLDGNTIIFPSRTNPDGLNPDGAGRLFTVKTDGTGLSVLPALVATGGQIVPIPSITRPISSANLTTLDVTGTPLNPNADHPEWGILEVFSVSNDQALQLTNFHRIDTGTFNATTDGRRVFFTASADPFGQNPFNNCQFFSMDPLGTDLRQLTQFGSAEPSTVGCGLPLQQPPAVGCTSYSGPILDPGTRALIFNSTCDPLGTNSNGEQYFAMRLDGTGLRQLTTTQGVRVGADGSVDAELPGPGAYSAPGGWLF